MSLQVIQVPTQSFRLRSLLGSIFQSEYRAFQKARFRQHKYLVRPVQALDNSYYTSLRVGVQIQSLAVLFAWVYGVHAFSRFRVGVACQLRFRLCAPAVTAAMCLPTWRRRSSRLRSGIQHPEPEKGPLRKVTALPLRFHVSLPGCT